VIWSPIDILRSLFPTRKAADAVAPRWRAAATRAPELRADLIRLGGLLALQPVIVNGGIPEFETPDAMRLAYEAGRRDLAMQILALMDTTPEIYQEMLEDNDV